MSKKTSPLKLGSETYEGRDIVEAFLKALEVYFYSKKEEKTSLLNGEVNPNSGT